MKNYKPKYGPLNYVTILEPSWMVPMHLKPLSDLFKRIAAWARGDNDDVIRATISVPIRHFKTETVLVGLVWLLEQFPWLNIALLAYNAERVNYLGKRLREYCRKTFDYVGPMKGWDRVDYWKNSEGGGVTILGYEQSREGFNIHVLIADDPINEIQVQKQEERDACDRALRNYTGRCLLYRNGGYVKGPVVIVASRFSRDDMIGRRSDWESFHKSAIDPKTGEPFAPEVFPLERLREVRADLARDDPREETWYSRWQGTPKEDRGADKFRPDPATYDFLPKGIDATGVYLIGERQWFAIVHVRISGGCAFVRSCHRFVAEPGELASRLNELGDRGEVYAFISGSERIAIRRLQEKGVVVTPLTSGQNRLWRSLRAIQLWDDNRILWPASGEGKMSIDRISKFTGGEDEETSEVDALVAVIEGAMLWAESAKPEKFGKRRYE